MTSWQHTSAEASRHQAERNFMEMGDVVIDNCRPQGDALIETGKIEKICSISSITGAFIAQSITTETCRLLSERRGAAAVAERRKPQTYGNENPEIRIP